MPVGVWQVPVEVVVAIEDNRTDGYMDSPSASILEGGQLVQDRDGHTYINTSAGGQVFSKMRSDLQV